MSKQKYYQVLLTEEQAEQLRYVCEDMSEPYSDMATEEENGGRPYVDRPSANFLTAVSETLDFVHMAIEEPVYEGVMPLLRIDADQTIHLLNVLADYHGFLVDYLSDKIGDAHPVSELVDDFYTLYLLGNIEGRLLYGGITEGDMKILTEWDEFLEGLKEEEFPEVSEEDGSGLIDLDKWFACPFCGKSSPGEELQYPIASGMLYVCRHCGCILDEKEVERQLGMEK